jgi:hypothetical protein
MGTVLIGYASVKPKKNFWSEGLETLDLSSLSIPDMLISIGVAIYNANLNQPTHRATIRIKEKPPVRGLNF